MTLALTDRLIEQTVTTEHRRLLEYIRHRLAADAVLPRHGGAFVTSGVDVERLFAAVEILIERRSQPWSPFVASWDADLESFGAPGAFGPTTVLRNVEEELDRRYLDHSTLYSVNRVSDAMQAVAREAIRLSQPDATQLLHVARQGMWDSLRSLLGISESRKVAYLRPLVEFAKSQPTFTVATLNYDVSVEMAAQSAGVVCDIRMGSQSESIDGLDMKLLSCTVRSTG